MASLWVEDKKHNDSVGMVPTLPDLIAIWRKTIRLMLRSAVAIALARILLGCLKALGKAKISRRALDIALDDALSLNPPKWAIVAAAVSSYHGVQGTLSFLLHNVMRRLLGDVVARRIINGLAGGITSFGFMAMNITTRTEIGLYAAMRAAHGVLSAHAWPRLPPALKGFQHWDVATMCLASCQILYNLMFEGTCNSLQYQTFCVRCTMTNPKVLASVAGLQREVIVPEAVEYAWKHKLPLLPASDLKQSCNFTHYGMTCGANMLDWYKRHLTLFSLPLYVPLKLTTTFLLGYKKAFRRPLTSLAKALSSSMWSSLFLTMYCGFPYGIICAFANMNLRWPAAAGIVSGICGGLMTFLEPKPRRIDLALYSMMQAVRGAVLLLVRRGWIRRPNRHHITLMSFLSMAAMFYQFEEEPEELHPNVVKTLAWLSGRSVAYNRELEAERK